MAKIKLLVMKNCYINHSYFCSSCLVLLDSFTLCIYSLYIFEAYAFIFFNIVTSHYG